MVVVGIIIGPSFDDLLQKNVKEMRSLLEDHYVSMINLWTRNAMTPTHGKLEFQVDKTVPECQECSYCNILQHLQLKAFVARQEDCCSRVV